MYRERARWGIWDLPADLLPAKYADGIVASGGIAVLLPVLAPDVDRVLDALDGVVICGGADVEPSHYDQQAHAEAGPFRPDRDDTELAIARVAVKRGVPVLGICRGMQVLNVALGGDLTQHLPDLAGSLAHQESPGVFSERSVILDADSFIGHVLGRSVPAACHHHQAVGRLADGLKIVGRADDGTPEAFESLRYTSSAPPVLGVQWHPEQGGDLRLFEAFVEAAAEPAA